jgi:EAL domain-containing protein (putative c-di-GMP-specific phosphodiesterase class I)
MSHVAQISHGDRRSTAGLDTNALEVHYEPIAELKTGDIVGAEALLRRRMPSGVVQIAARFLPLAESTGLIVEMGRRVIDKACTEAAGWQKDRRGAVVAVNISSRQLSDPALPGWVEAVLVRHSLPASRLMLDVSEMVVANAAVERGHHLEQLHALAALGVQIAIDDVGTGASSPTYLSRVPASLLKIDGRFTRSIRDPERSHLATAIIELAHELGLQAIAEGIEDEEDAAVLKGLGCDFAQGYAIGRAMGPTNIASKLRG